MSYIEDRRDWEEREIRGFSFFSNILSQASANLLIESKEGLGNTVYKHLVPPKEESKV